MTMKCAIYARVSSDEQAQGLSLETQIEAGRKYAASQGWQVAGEYVDPGFSGTTDERPAFKQMIGDALVGEFEALILYSFDRFARNMEHAATYKALLRRDNIQIVSLMEQLDPDDPMSFIFEGMVDLFAAYYSINLSTKIKNGLEKAVKQGEWPLRVPMGYLREQGVIKVSADGPLVSWAFREFATGKYTLVKWANQACELGARQPRSHGKMRGTDWSRTFNNKFYIGIMTWKGAEYTGNHPQLTDIETWNRVQLALQTNNTSRRPFGNRRVYLLRRLIWSVNSNSRMGGAASRGKGGVYRYYRSTKPGPDGKRHHVLASKLETAAATALQHISIDLADINKLKDITDEQTILGLRVAPDLTVLYNNLESREQRIALLNLVIADYGFRVFDDEIIAVVARKPFIGLDLFSVELRGFEPLTS